MKFKEYIKAPMSEALKTSESIDGEISYFILRSMHLVSTTHITHLLSNNHGEHLAINEFYNSLQDLLDSLAETSIGADLAIYPVKFEESLEFKYDLVKFITSVSMYREACSGLITRTNESGAMSVNNVLVDIQACIDTLLYKLRLK